MGSPTPPDEQNAPQLNIEHSARDAAHVVALEGELDLRTAPELEAALENASTGEHACVCLDLTRLQFIDSTGLAVVIRAQQAAASAGGVLAIVCGEGAVRRTFEITGLLTMLHAVHTVDEALVALGS